jgi:hypothetical protein
VIIVFGRIFVVVLDLDKELYCINAIKIKNKIRIIKLRAYLWNLQFVRMQFKIKYNLLPKDVFNLTLNFNHLFYLRFKIAADN